MFSTYDYSYLSKIWSPQNLYISLCYFVRGIQIRPKIYKLRQIEKIDKMFFYVSSSTSPSIVLFNITIMRTIHIINTEHVTLQSHLSLFFNNTTSQPNAHNYSFVTRWWHKNTVSFTKPQFFLYHSSHNCKRHDLKRKSQIFLGTVNCSTDQC